MNNILLKRTSSNFPKIQSPFFINQTPVLPSEISSYSYPLSLCSTKKTEISWGDAGAIDLIPSFLFLPSDPRPVSMKEEGAGSSVLSPSTQTKDEEDLDTQSLLGRYHFFLSNYWNHCIRFLRGQYQTIPSPRCSEPCHQGFVSFPCSGKVHMS